MKKNSAAGNGNRNGNNNGKGNKSAAVSIRQKLLNGSTPGSSGASIRSTTIFQEPFKLLYFLIPVALVLLVGTCLMGIDDTLQVLRWGLMLTIFGLAVYPLSSMLFPDLRSGGFFLSKPLGLLSVGLIVWTLTYLKIFRFNRVFIIITLIAAVAICYGIRPLRENLINKLSQKSSLENIVIEESIFFLILTLLCYFKGFLPNINGEEKFMNYGFMMSMIRSSRLPANDMWLSGYSINYYYFGQYLYTMVVKVCGIKPAIAYNIAMCTSIAIPFSMCHSVGCLLIEASRKAGLRCNGIVTQVTGVLCAFCAIIFGNSHSFFYDENSIGNSFLLFLKKHGVNVGRTDGFFYPDSTRFIGWNPESKGLAGIADENGILTGDHTIEEFPFYSFLVGDLHAHVVSTMIVLLIMAIAISIISKAITTSMVPENSLFLKRGLANFNPKTGILTREYRKVITLGTVSIALLLGCAQMTNYWDFLIYFIFTSMTLLVLNIKQSHCFANITGTITFFATLGAILGMYLFVGDRPYIHCLLQFLVLLLVYFLDVFAPCCLSRTALGMSFVFTASNITALPFNSAFDMISNSVARTIDHTSFFQLWILWGTHVTICVTFFVMVMIFKNYKKASAPKKGKKNVRSYSSKTSSRGSSDNIYGVPSDGFPNPIARFVGERNVIDFFVCGMIVVGLMMIIAPEIIYVRDIYVFGHLRANTMFKFTYAGFIILSVSMAYSIIRMFWFIGKKGRFSNAPYIIAIIFCIMLIVPGHYTYVALKQRCGSFEKENYKGLDGTLYLETHASTYAMPDEFGTYRPGNLLPYLDCIEWFNSEVTGTPVIMEMYGWSYTDNNIVSAYTGLQTVVGWHTHEQLWRFHGIVNPETNLLEADPDNNAVDKYLTPRHDDIFRFYTTSDPKIAQGIIDKYSIEYVILGDLERGFLKDYTDPETLGSILPSVGEVVFESGTLQVYKTTPGESVTEDTQQM